MLFNQLTERQKICLACHEPDWVADHHAEWMADHFQSWMEQHRRGWMVANRLNSMMENHATMMAERYPKFAEAYANRMPEIPEEFLCRHLRDIEGE
jgi:hypothetical protein